MVIGKGMVDRGGLSRAPWMWLGSIRGCFQAGLHRAKAAVPDPQVDRLIDGLGIASRQVGLARGSGAAVAAVVSAA